MRQQIVDIGRPWHQAQEDHDDRCRGFHDAVAQLDQMRDEGILGTGGFLFFSHQPRQK